MAGPQLQGISAAWLRREDWPRWREIDPTMRPDYDGWLAKMEAAFTRYQQAGIPIVKVMIDPDEFLTWAKDRGVAPDSNGRAAFAAFKTMKTETR